MTIRIYKSTDGNAPILNGVRGSLINVLKKCLVDGYGTKPGAGWTMPFISAAGNRACFRNAGTGFFLQIDQETTSANYAAASAYEIMTSDSSGTNQFGTTVGLSYQVSSTTDTAARPWICVANDKYFYFVTYYGATAMPTSPATIYGSPSYYGLNMFFGDFEKAYVDDGFACAFLRSTWATGGRYGFGDCAPASASREGHYIARALTGVVGVIGCAAMMAPPGAVSGVDCYGSRGPVYDGQTPLMISKVALNNGAINTFRGYMPGLYAPCHTHPYNNLDTLTINGDSYVVVTWMAMSGSGNQQRAAQAFLKVEE